MEFAVCGQKKSWGFGLIITLFLHLLQLVVYFYILNIRLLRCQMRL